MAFFLFFSEMNVFSQKAELPLKVKNAPESSLPMIFYITGDGGWNMFDNKMSTEFEASKVPYIGLNSFRYFWSKKTPDQLAKDVIPVLYKYLKEWNKEEIAMIGYSFGAEILPFLVTRLPSDLKEKVKLIAMITPSETSDFTIHVNDMLTFNGKYDYDVIAEVRKISSTNIFCFFGENETSLFDKSHLQKNLYIRLVKGGHHFTDAKTVMKEILDASK
jgi:type IV secretory pathway VirJ component